MDSNQKNVIKTLLYSSLFSFPLTFDELYRYYISSKPVTISTFTKILQSMSSRLILKQDYYVLKGHENFIAHRINMSKEVDHKRKIAMNMVSVLGKIPTIYFIGISGSLAAGSARKSDDIDLFVITKKNTIFVSRLCALILLQILRKRRKVGDKNASDKICMNMWLDTDSLAFPKSSHDLYIAREIAQLVPLFDRENTYQYFIRQNNWIETFLAHALKKQFRPSMYGEKNTLYEWLLERIEILARTLQLFFINRHRTTEEVTSHTLLFHPVNYRKYILSDYKKLLTKRAKLL